jgi:hypothetical protein
MKFQLLLRHHISIIFFCFIVVLYCPVSPSYAFTSAATVTCTANDSVSQLYKEDTEAKIDFKIEDLKSLQKTLLSIQRTLTFIANETVDENSKKLLERLNYLEDCNEMKDLILYWKGLLLMALSYNEAEKTFDKLLGICQKNVCSPLILKKAWLNLIEIKLLDNRSDAISQLERYVNLYPEDDYAIYLLAYLYKQEGKDALSLYKRLYVKNSSYMRFIDKEINPEILNHEEFQEKVRSLMARAQYEEAERLVRERLERERSATVTFASINREALMRLLGTIYFRQKRYAEAARVFENSKEYYLLALSLLRAGKNEEANKVIEKLIRSKDRRVVPVAIAYARSLRDSGEIGASIKYLKELLKSFPLDSEQIQWAIAWTHYITGEYEEAKRVLLSLRDKYKKPRYEYWLLRAEERSSSLVAKETVDRHESELKLISQQDNGIYSLLAGYRLQAIDKLQSSGVRLKKNNSLKETSAFSLRWRGNSKPSACSLWPSACVTPPAPTFSHIRIKRAHIFMELGLKDEAIEELSILINRCLPPVTSPEVEIIRLSGKAGESNSSGEFNDKQSADGASNSANGASNSWGESNSCGDLLASIGSFYYRTGQYHRAVSLYSRLKSTPSLKDRIDDVLLYPVVYSDYIINASKKYSIDPFLLLAIAREESRYNPEAISPAGAIGLLQIMPSTARRLSLEIKKDNGSVGGEVAVEAQRWPALLTDPALNIELGAFYLSRLIKRYGVLSYAIAAYNAGEAAVDSWLKNNYSDEDEFIEDIPYGETINYVKRVLTTYEKYLRIYRQMLPYQ